MKSLISSSITVRLGRLQSILVYGSLALLLFLLCARVWNFGITHTDDARWAMPGYFLGIDPIADWAISQGRIWAYLSGTLILWTLQMQGSVAGELVRLGSFVLFFIVFFRYFALLCDRRFSLIAATFFLSFFMLKWDGSLLTTYPLLSWLAGGALILALELSARFVSRGSRWALALAMTLFGFSLVNNEGITVLFMFLFFVHTIALNHAVDESTFAIAKLHLRRRSAVLLLLFFVVAATYAAIYLAWFLSHPSIYDGHKLGGFKLLNFLKTLTHFSTSGSALHDLISPYSVPFADAIAMTGERKEYFLTRNLQRSLHDPSSLLVCIVTIFLMWNLLKNVSGKSSALIKQATASSFASSVSSSASTWAKSRWSLQKRMYFGLLIGLSVAILPIIPVALTSKYQTWVMESQIQAYSHTIFSHFGWSCVFAFVMLVLFEKLAARTVLRNFLLGVVALFSGLIASQAFTANDDMAADMRNESGRWYILQKLLEVNQQSLKSDYVWVPRFASGSWYSSVDRDYWTQYAKKRYGDKTVIGADGPDLVAQSKNYVVSDYIFDRHGKRFVAIAASLNTSNASSEDNQTVSIFIEGGVARHRADYFLLYKDRNDHEVHQSLNSLDPNTGNAEWGTLDLNNVEPTSIQLYRLDRKRRQVRLCGLVQLRGAAYSIQSGATTNLVINDRQALKSGWSAVELNGIWSDQSKAYLHLNTFTKQAHAWQVKMQLNNLAGQIDDIPEQTLIVRSKDRILGRWTFERMQNQSHIEFNLPVDAFDANGDFELELEVTPLVSQMKPSGNRDQRNLGVFLKGIELIPTTEAKTSK
ncbi:hypothetical protein RF679_06300 [Undibacterium cyanobacteriorum]|uniref:Glycosyltransferase RgtA/B/C/D-like domain-containing protein n=1 Tax=Undibacterium cyanobacteriorum TaxID=3073561 RepID=A0ABY9RKZ3_9BURK|nr:hypothetical protein [Undibacterium sp. 20NA77.5]WMW81891.1 hypothetical protein RF679_06300 [Undibacterium sp. 20NA77.5]